MSHVFYRQPKHDYPIAVRGEGIEIIDRAGNRYLCERRRRGIVSWP
jgi:hypothetical protein